MAEAIDNDNEQQEAQINPPQESFSNTSGIFGSMMSTKNMILIAVILLTVLFLIGRVLFTPKYQTVFSNLAQSDAAAISAHLEKEKIKFKISPDGTAVQVAGMSVPKLRLELASKGLPRGSGVGFEIFDKTNINISDFNQKINYNRALEGELSRTISSLDSIKSAKVHLAISKKSIFKDQNNDSKASVIINPEFGAKLSEEQIKGIQHLVASAVEGLETDYVQITDQEGNALVKPNDKDSLEQNKTANNDVKLRSYEKKLEKELIEMLSPILGAGNVLVNITAEMNFDESEMNIELFSPTIGEDGQKAEPVVRSEKTSQERYKNEKPNNFGTAGTQNNMPSFVKNGEPRPTEKDYNKEDKTKNYEISKSVERIRKASGLLKKLSVAVVVNKELSPSERSTLRQTVQVAAGLNLERGDQVIVTGIRFSSTPYSDIASQEAQKHLSQMEKEAKIKKYLSLALILAVGVAMSLVLLFSLTIGIDNSRAKEIDNILDEEEIPMLKRIDNRIQEAEEAYTRQLSLEGNRSVGAMKDGLSQMAMQDPKTIARGLQAYMND
ncbi:MAG: flagellar basal-body MS-ring/collar protein FliF [Cyanobacteria bacterium]|nr:flagellar basal-body MS-ring/collar protein FliF [Cyanobacteriota bacterium]MDA1021290.1 flagellar basal-body MS-ring/collar protein FliF [Cyanobacteriota bacterium]